MDRSDKTALVGIALAVVLTVVGIAAPSEFPEFPALLGHVLFWGGSALVLGLILFLVHEHFLKEGKKTRQIGLPVVCTVIFIGLSVWRFSGLAASALSQRPQVAIVEAPTSQVVPPNASQELDQFKQWTLL